MRNTSETDYVIKCNHVSAYGYFDSLVTRECSVLGRPHRAPNSAAAEAQKGLYLRSYPYRRYNKLILVSF